MKYISIILLFISQIAFSQVSSYEIKPILDDRIPVIGKSGQSNGGVGQFALKNKGYNEILYEDRGVHDSILIFNEGNYLTFDTTSGSLVKTQWNINTTGDVAYTNPANDGYNIGQVSTEMECSHQLNDFYDGKKVVIIKSGYGAKDIRSWDKSTDSTEWVKLERAFKHTTAIILAEGKVPNFISFGWMQAESDIINGQTAFYETRLRTFINNLRSINQYTASMQFVMFKLSLSGNEAVGMATINNAFETLANENPLNVVIETAGQSQYNSLHYDLPALTNLGRKWFYEIKKLYQYQTINKLIK